MATLTNTKYQPSVDIWAVPEAYTKRLQPGQWVTAGGARGRFLGFTKAGSIVVAWSGRKAKLRALRAYAQGVN